MSRRVVVLGGGVVGLLAAARHRDAGDDVTLVEAARLGGLLRSEEIETMVALLLADPERNHQRIHSVMQPAVDRFHALDSERQDAFRDVLTRFTRIYSFLSQVVSFTDVKLERDYLFCRRLAQLVREESVASVDLGDSVELTHLRMEKVWQGDASLDVDDGEVVTIYGGAGGGRRVEEVPLSEIIQRINDRFGTNISDTDRLFADQVADDIVANETIQVQALANSEEAFSVGFDTTWTKALTGRMNANEQFAFQLLDNQDLRAAVVEEQREAAAPVTDNTSQVVDQSEAAPSGENRLLSIWGLVSIGSDLAEVDPGALVVLFAMINVFIGVFNLLPLLPFDGGHVAIAVYERIQELRLGRRRYLADVGRLIPFTYAVVLLMGMLFVSTIYLDIANPMVAR